MQSYRELIVWQKSMALVKAIYDAVNVFPKTETYALSDQLRRAAVSIPSNIAEGFARVGSKDYCHFLSIAKGSVYEVDTQLRIAVMLGFLTEEQSAGTLSLCAECGRMLNSMITKLSV